ncbi:MAG: hypothetical protein ACREMG_07135, partial [Gemmatimonadales bacterium]
VGMSEVWLRVVIYKSDSDNPEADEQYLKRAAQEAVRVYEKMDGCTLGYFGHDKRVGTMAAVTYWSSLEAIEASKPALKELQQQRASEGVQLVSESNFRLREFKLD